MSVELVQTFASVWNALEETAGGDQHAVAFGVGSGGV